MAWLAVMTHRLICSFALLYGNPAGHHHPFTGNSFFPRSPSQTTNARMVEMPGPVKCWLQDSWLIAIERHLPTEVPPVGRTTEV